MLTKAQKKMARKIFKQRTPRSTTMLTAGVVNAGTHYADLDRVCHWMILDRHQVTLRDIGAILREAFPHPHGTSLNLSYSPSGRWCARAVHLHIGRDRVFIRQWHYADV